MKFVLKTNLQKIAMRAIVTLVALVSLNACVNIGIPHGMGPGGGLVSSYTIGLSAHKLPNGDPNVKTSEACTYQIFPILLFASFSWGHATITDVAKKAQINTIYTVNKDIFNFLYIFSSMCVVVTGVEGGNPSANAEGGASGTVSGFGDKVTMKNGKVYQNVKAAVAGNRIVITTTAGKTIVVEKAKVKAIKRGK